MTENQKQLKVAFDKNWEGYYEQETWSGDGIYKDKSKLRNNTIFEAELIYSGFTRGRSALNIKWIDHINKKIYYSGMSLLDQTLKEGLIVDGNTINGKFCFKKQGTSILLEAAQ